MIEITSPYWLVLLFFLIIGIAARKEKYFIIKAYSYLESQRRGRGEKVRPLARILLALPSFFALIVIFGLIVSLVDVTKSYFVTRDSFMSNRLIVALDSSSSMYEFSTSYSKINCNQEAADYIRIEGACIAVHTLIEEVERFVSENKAHDKTFIGIVQFARNSAAISYPTDEYADLHNVVDEINWMQQNGLGIHTNIHYAFWDMIQMALKRNLVGVEGFTKLTKKELKLLGDSFTPKSSAVKYSPPEEIKEKLEKIREELRDTAFIFITDALASYLKDRLNAAKYSFREEFKFASWIELPVIMISTDETDIEIRKLLRDTGSGPIGGPNRGELLMVKRERDFELIGDLMKKVVRTRLSRKIKLPVERRESYAHYFLFLSLISVLLYVITKKIFIRSLTDV